jgi:hypothetical protein
VQSIRQAADAQNSNRAEGPRDALMIVLMLTLGPSACMEGWCQKTKLCFGFSKGILVVGLIQHLDCAACWGLLQTQQQLAW